MGFGRGKPDVWLVHLFPRSYRQVVHRGTCVRHRFCADCGDDTAEKEGLKVKK